MPSKIIQRRARFNKYLYKYWKPQVLVTLISGVTVLLALINPYLTKLVIDKAYGDRDLKLFLILAVIGGSVFVINTALSFLERYLSKRINSYIYADIVKDLFRHLQRLPLWFFDSRSSSEHLFKIEYNTRRVSDFICNVIPETIRLFPRLLFIIAILFFLEKRLAIFTFFIVPLTFIHPYLFAKLVMDITHKLMDKSQNLFKGLHEAFTHIRLIKAMRREPYEIKRFEDMLIKKIDIDMRNERLMNISGFSNTALSKIISGVIALYGGYLVIKGDITLGSLSAVMIYITQLVSLTGSIGKFFENVAASSVSQKRISEIFDMKPCLEDEEDAKDYRLHGAVEFRSVSFGYKEGRPVLRDLNFSVPYSSKVALVGPSGSGKTTIASLILRLYEPEGGTIFLDGIDIKKIKTNSLRSQVGIVLQEPFLWDDTIAANITYGKEGATLNEIIKVSEIACAHEFIEKLPKGYDTIVGEMACRISEGQKQRIAIARAIIKRPKVLILDEPFSSIDAQTEERIINNIKNFLKDSTIITISHHLSTIMKLDSVYFLTGPNEIYIDTHEELLKKNSEYQSYLAHQLKEEDKILNEERRL